MQATQPLLIPLSPAVVADTNFPSTRYQGSKRKLLEWIWENVGGLQFQSVLDVFGGTGAVSYLFKCAGKQVIYNDILQFNALIGKALIENSNVTLTSADVEQVLMFDPEQKHNGFIRETFRDIFFTDEENQWLDSIVQNINNRLNDPYKQALAWFALFQSCIAKRPYNLFHRANLYMRMATVDRGFGNKTTWDRPFADHFRSFVEEANRAVFDNGQRNTVLNEDAARLKAQADLVYLDPPYISENGVGVDYRDFYHFLEGMILGEKWKTQVDYKSRHRRLTPQRSDWVSSERILTAFEATIARHNSSIVVISYREDGIPSKKQLLEILTGFKREIREASLPKKYVLSTRSSRELLLIAK